MTDGRIPHFVHPHPPTTAEMDAAYERARFMDHPYTQFRKRINELFDAAQDLHKMLFFNEAPQPHEHGAPHCELCRVVEKGRSEG